VQELSEQFHLVTEYRVYICAVYGNQHLSKTLHRKMLLLAAVYNRQSLAQAAQGQKHALSTGLRRRKAVFARVRQRRAVKSDKGCRKPS